MGNLVAIIGRPNVGKSTLFNRLTESRKAIVHEQSGVTRDRTYGDVEWNGKQFTVIDTGGYIMGSEDAFEADIRKQVEIAVEEADLIIFLVDVQTGVLDTDKAVAAMLRQTDKKVFLVVNKVDTNEKQLDAVEFYELGLGDYHCISSVNGSGTGDLLDEIVQSLEIEEEEEAGDVPKLAIVGRPNVGKSSLVNALLGKERSIVNPQAGTTRDTINTHLKSFGHEFILVDTAGIRKKSKVHENVEFYSVMRSIKAIENCDVVVLMIDAQYGIESQDMNIFHLAQRNRKGLVLLINKWDLVEKETNTARDYAREIKNRIAPFTDVPVIFISALTKQRIIKALDAAKMVYENRIRKIPTNKLNNVMLPVIEKNPPPSVRGRYVKIKFLRQLPTHAPTFAFYCNHPKDVKEPYKRFLENKLRENFELTGVPVQIFIRQK